MKNIDSKTLKSKLDRREDFLLLNTLSHETFLQGHIPGSENIPYDDNRFEEKVEQKVRSKDKEIVVYCADQKCQSSGKAVQQLQKAGFTNIKHYTGGMKAWKDAGYKVEGRKRAA